GKVSNRNLGIGCVAFVLANGWIPWVEVDGQSPGNANQWDDKARAFAAAHPEYGVVVDKNPSPGAIMVHNGGGGGYGHVGIVSEVYDGNSFQVQAGDTWAAGKTAGWGEWYNSQGQLNTANVYNDTVSDDVYFIHLPWVEASY
ncbi:MAG: CHAP domain-containing protein, partial [Anaerolineae bacterium]|nr:CHAP domain-containing protein [Anaerolineae bacterium]